jgi:glycine/D-amino acid oxidase-like deaminating enzyme
LQVHPELFTKALIDKVKEAGGELRLARLTGLETSGGRVTAVRVVEQGAEEETRLPADVVVLALGEHELRPDQPALLLPCLVPCSSSCRISPSCC